MNDSICNEDQYLTVSRLMCYVNCFFFLLIMLVPALTRWMCAYVSYFDRYEFGFCLWVGRYVCTATLLFSCCTLFLGFSQMMSAETGFVNACLVQKTMQIKSE